MKSYSNDIVDSERLQKMHEEQETQIANIKVELDITKNNVRKLTIFGSLLLVFCLVIFAQIL